MVLATSFDSQHEDMIHDAQMDYYGRKLATCSSDKTIRIFEITNEKQKLIQVLTGHQGPVWQLAWAHPKFGNILASCSYDSSVIIWKQVDGQFQKLKEHKVHDASVNAISFAPFELGLILACGSSDGKVSILTYKEDSSTWESTVFHAHQIGCNSVCWSPSNSSSLFTGSVAQQPLKRLVTAGCDNLIKIWKFQSNSEWTLECDPLQGHSDWVRDAQFAPNQTMDLIASCSQDKMVFIWTLEKGVWTKKALRDPFPDVVWRVSWSLSGNVLAVSCGDNKVSIWREGTNGFELASELDENSMETQ